MQIEEEEDFKPKPIDLRDVTKPKPKRSKSVVIEEITEGDVENDTASSQKVPEAIDLEANNKLNRAISVTKEEADEGNVAAKSKEVEIIPVDEDSKAKPGKGRRATIEEAEAVDNELANAQGKKLQEKKLHRQESKKGISTGDEEDTELENLLNRAQKQRSLVEDVTSKPEGTILHIKHAFIIFIL